LELEKSKAENAIVDESHLAYLEIDKRWVMEQDHILVLPGDGNG
jgi:hypothetical protein